ncbi:hypothetical protein GCM10017788_35280 [Amycolatopsis acidiphila]|nr:hypothetical protein GCM10017788_35280 [Amycolatopsis acidiphila]
MRAPTQIPIGMFFQPPVGTRVIGCSPPCRGIAIAVHVSPVTRITKPPEPGDVTERETVTVRVRKQAHGAAFNPDRSSAGMRFSP